MGLASLACMDRGFSWPPCGPRVGQKHCLTRGQPIAKRAKKLHIALLALTSTLSLGCNKAPSAPLRPSLLLVIVDTLRADHLGTYGYTAATSPVIDGVATSAVVFEAASTPAPLTMPAVAALMTGMYPDRLGVINHTRRDRLDAKTPTLAELTRAAGYRTAAVVANPWLANRTMGFDRGFERFITKRSRGVRGRLDAATLTDLAIGVLEEDRDQPVFLWVHYLDAHMPYSPPAAFARLMGNTRGTSAIIDDFNADADKRQAIYFDGGYEDSELEATRQLYDASIRYIDTEIGRLLDAFARLRPSQPVITVITADHGESLGDHGLYFAHDFTLYDELIHVPLILRVPGLPGHRVAGEVSLVDLTPTLCELVDLHCPTDLDGRPLVLDGSPAKARTVFAASVPARARYARNPWLFVDGEAGRLTMARRDGRKLIRIPHGEGPRWEAYQLTDDPHELVNIYDSQRLVRLREELDQWITTMRSVSTKRDSAVPPLRRPTREALRALGYLD